MNTLRNRLIATTAILCAPADKATSKKVTGKSVSKSAAWSFTIPDDESMTTDKFPAGAVLSTERHVFDWLAGFDLPQSFGDVGERVAASAENPKGREAMFAAFRALDLSGTDADDMLEAIVKAMSDVPVAWNTADYQPINTQVLLSAPEHSLALEVGKALPAAVVDQLEASYDGLLKYDEGPIMTYLKMLPEFKDRNFGNVPFIKAIPPLGTKYHGDDARGNKAPAGYRHPGEKNTQDKERAKLPIWEGPYDRYIDKEGNKGDFVAEVFATTPRGAYLNNYLAHAKNMASDSDKARHVTVGDTPTELKGLFATGGKERISEEVAAISRRIQKEVGMLRTGLMMWQRMEEFADHFDLPNNEIRAVLVGQDIGESETSIARKRKPIRLETYVYSKNAKGDTVANAKVIKTMPLGSFIRLTPTVLPKNVSPAKFNEKKPRKTGGATAPNAATNTATANKVTDDAAFITSVMNAGLFVDSLPNLEERQNKYAFLRSHALKDGATAFAYLQLHGVLTNLLTADVRKAATDWDAQQSAINREADAA